MEFVTQFETLVNRQFDLLIVRARKVKVTYYDVQEDLDHPLDSIHPVLQNARNAILQFAIQLEETVRELEVKKQEMEDAERVKQELQQIGLAEANNRKLISFLSSRNRSIVESICPPRITRIATNSDIKIDHSDMVTSLGTVQTQIQEFLDGIQADDLLLKEAIARDQVLSDELYDIRRRIEHLDSENGPKRRLLNVKKKEKDVQTNIRERALELKQAERKQFSPLTRTRNTPRFK
ncbi:hypothetical protein SS50377_21880 [Spironucleus salmonicida]|uniref:Uncharacterized protein n=1 Tax=Spironucleus salmonicida TaxID=348837 RepID=V6LIP3_9EUKA|nr:hypothetical protein SS50377_21880 [Spironucleus salmonicida]|eukprot:EST44422.1 Hypothetical protein SS50377_15728 [Spironucleus salmonicida]